MSVLESLMVDTCTIYTEQNEADSYGIQRKKEAVWLENQKCRISFSSSPNTSGDVASVSQSIRLFLPASIVPPAGCEADVIRQGVAVRYKMSGQPSIYPTHTEIDLILKEYA